MKTVVIRAFWVALGFAVALSLPCAAAEPASGDGLRRPEVTAGSQAPTADLSAIFGTPVPRPASSVDCFECGGGPNSPYRQCYWHCAAMSSCVDQCYVESTTCELNNCICLPC